MQKMIIEGGHRLKGTVKISGSKNAVLPMMAAALLAPGRSIIRNVPELADIDTMAEVLRILGARVAWEGKNTLAIDATELTSHIAPYDWVRRMRASINVLGPLCARLGKARVSLPGGCSFGPRPVDLHLKGLKALGASIKIDHGYIVADCPHLKGAKMLLEGGSGPSRGATANVLMAAVLAEGMTILEGAAMEPETEDLVKFLNCMGAKIEGGGTSHLIITGVKEMRPCEYAVMDDQIEAGTYAIAGIMAGDDVTVEGMYPQWNFAVLDAFERLGVRYDEGSNWVRVYGDGELKPTEVVTSPYPGFPTDMQAQMMALMTIVPGISTVTERIYPERFMHVPELIRLGANVKIEGAMAIVNGVNSLSGAYVMANDLRASAALVLAGLIAEGETHVRRIYHLDRGYEQLEEKLAALGAKIRRVDEDDEAG